MKKLTDFTILIAARNAAATIQRAVRSALAESPCPVILIDDQCTDETVALAQRCAGGNLRVVSVPAPGGIPLARQAGLDAIETKYAGWLDADDEWLAGRAMRLRTALANGADVATESIALHDGLTGMYLRHLRIPSFLKPSGAWVRLFERNYLPGDTQVAFRTKVFRRAGGYDPAVYGTESFDLLLRVLRNGAHFSWGENLGYRMFAYPNSVSRSLKRQRAALSVALCKHSYTDVERLYEKARIPYRITAWGLVSFALFCNDLESALLFLKKACPIDMRSKEVLEPNGPYPIQEGWRYGFTRGTLHLLMDEPEDAIEYLTVALSLRRSAEVLNNLGVAYSKIHGWRKYSNLFRQALEMFPGYLDASLNSQMKHPCHVTTHPLRLQPTRGEYSPTAN